MPIRRNQPSAKRVIAPIFDKPDGLEDLEYKEDYEELDEQGDDDDYVDVDDDDKTKKPKKKKRKRKGKKKRKRKRKGKKKRKKKDGKKKKRKKRDKKDKKDKPDKDKKTKTPNSFEVVKQTIRTKKDGSQVVDLTVDVDKINKADKYEFRVTMKDTGKTTVVNG